MILRSNQVIITHTGGISYIFKALSDSVRLQIMNYVLEKPSTTQSLAQILLMTESSNETLTNFKTQSY